MSLMVLLASLLVGCGATIGPFPHDPPQPEPPSPWDDPANEAARHEKPKPQAKPTTP